MADEVVGYAITRARCRSMGEACGRIKPTWRVADRGRTAASVIVTGDMPPATQEADDYIRQGIKKLQETLPESELQRRGPRTRIDKAGQAPRAPRRSLDGMMDKIVSRQRFGPPHPSAFNAGHLAMLPTAEYETLLTAMTVLHPQVRGAPVALRAK